MFDILIKTKRILALCLVLILIWGCGYHFRADGNPEGIAISSLAIPLMTSTSSALGFESDFTEVIRDAFIRHGNVPLVPVDQASMVLIGRIRQIRTDPVTYDLTEYPNVTKDTTEYYVTTDSRRLWVKLDVTLIDRKTGKVIWQEQSMIDRARFLVTKDPLTNRYNQKKALQEIAGRLVDRIYLRTMERF